jgi:hypothetical protein
MATSGSVDFNQTRNEIIQDALALLGVYGVGRTISSEDMNFSSNMLNKMIKTYQGAGLHLWAKEEAYLFIADNTAEYTLSSDATSARMSLRSDTVITELNGAHAASATTLVVDSTTGMTAADIIGIVNDDDAVTWTTIVSVDSSTGLTITAGLDGACADNRNVYTFTSRVNKPLRILGMRRVTSGPGSPSSIPMMALSHEEYFDLPNKETNGNPTHFYYNPDLTTGNLYLWARPDDPEMYFEVTFERMLEDFDASTNTPDFPSEWLECLTYQLAVRLAPAFGKINMLQVLAPIAQDLYTQASGFDQEITSVSMQIDTGR